MTPGNPTGEGRWRGRDAAGDPLLLRPTAAPDRAELMAMYGDYGDEDRTLCTPPEGGERVERWVDRHLRESETFVADQEGVVGQLLLAGPGDAVPEVGVYVHPEEFGHGVGTALCRHAVRSAEGRYDGLSLVVEASNRRARHVFEKVGFEVVDRRTGVVEMRHPL